MWLDSSVDRAQKYKKKARWIEHRTGIARPWFESRSSLNFFRLFFFFFQLLSSWKHNARITISLMFIRGSYIWFSYIITVIGCITNSQLTVYPCGSIAQRIDYCTGIAKSWVRVPFKLELFSGCFFNCLSLKHAAKITISLMFIRSSHIWFSNIYIRIEESDIWNTNRQLIPTQEHPRLIVD